MVYTHITESEARLIRNKARIVRAPRLLHNLKIFKAVCNSPRQLTKNDVFRLMLKLQLPNHYMAAFKRVYGLPNEDIESEYDSDETVCD